MSKLNLFSIPELKDNKQKGEPKNHTFTPTLPKKEYVECYTDGGCHNYGKYKGIGAWAYFIKNHLDNSSYKGCYGAYDTTNNEMELRALYELLKFLHSEVDPKETPIKVYCDSRYVVDTINEARYVNWMYNGWRTGEGTDVKNVDLWKEVISIYKEFYNLELIHIRGHIGIYGNETCDKMCGKMIERFKQRKEDNIERWKEHEILR